MMRTAEERRRSLAHADEIRDEALRAVLLSAESAPTLAVRFGVSLRTIQRYRRAVRGYGARVLVPTAGGYHYDPMRQRPVEAA